MSLTSIVSTFLRLLTSSRYRVEGNSMAPALTSGQYVLAARLGGLDRWPLHRGQIVVLRHPILKDRIFIKRIVGMPNECLGLAGALIFIDGFRLAEPYLGDSENSYNEQDREWWLGPQEYFVLSDNRSDGRDDSRAFGYIGQDSIVARVWLRYWPPGAWGKIN